MSYRPSRHYAASRRIEHIDGALRWLRQDAYWMQAFRDALADAAAFDELCRVNAIDSYKARVAVELINRRAEHGIDPFDARDWRDIAAERKEVPS